MHFLFLSLLAHDDVHIRRTGMITVNYENEYLLLSLSLPLTPKRYSIYFSHDQAAIVTRIAAG